MKRYSISSSGATRRFLDRNRDRRFVCPFPGRNPLHLSWEIKKIDRRTGNLGEVVASFNGKLTGEAWKQYLRSIKKYGEDYDSRWRLYDRLKTQAFGFREGFLDAVPYWFNRYIYGYASQVAFDFSEVKRIKVGPYFMYDIDLVERTNATDARIIRSIDTKVPTLRRA